MKKKVTVIIFLIALIACSRQPLDVPPDLIEEKEMTEILTDLHIGQSGINERIKKDSTNISPDYTADDLLEIILQNHKKTREQFLKSLKFYSDNPEILSVVYDSVIIKLNAPPE